MRRDDRKDKELMRGEFTEGNERFAIVYFHTENTKSVI